MLPAQPALHEVSIAPIQAALRDDGDLLVTAAPLALPLRESDEIWQLRMAGLRCCASEHICP